MRFFLFSILLGSICLLATPAQAQIPGAVWAKTFGSTSGEFAWDFLVLPDGDIVVTGTYEANMNLGNGVSLSNLGLEDGFVARFSEEGNVLWARALSGPGQELISHVAADAQGNLYLSGYYQAGASFLSQSLANLGKKDGFIAKLNSAGDLAFVKTFTDTSDASVGRVEVGTSGSVMAYGTFGGLLTVGDSTLARDKRRNIFTACFNATGDLLRLKRHVAGTDLAAIGMAPLPQGGFAVTGNYFGVSTFGASTLPNTGLGDIFLAKLTDLGEPVWVRPFGGTGTDLGIDVKADAEGNIFASGSFSNTMQVGTNPLTSNGLWDAYLAKYSTDGQVLWANSYGGTGNERLNGIHLDTDGSTWCFGWFQNELTINGTTYTSAGFNDALLVKMGPTGNLQAAKAIGGTGIEGGVDVSADPAGNLLLLGSHTAAFSLDNLNLTTTGTHDVYIVRLGGPLSVKNDLDSEHAPATRQDDSRLYIRHPGSLQLFSADGRQLGTYACSEPGFVQTNLPQTVIFYRFTPATGRLLIGKL